MLTDEEPPTFEWTELIILTIIVVSLHFYHEQSQVSCIYIMHIVRLEIPIILLNLNFLFTVL